MTGSIARVVSRLFKVCGGRELLRFVKHNRRVFSPQPKSGRLRPEVLVEANNLHSAHIAYSYLANVLADQDGARIVAYFAEAPRGWWSSLNWMAKQAVSHSLFGAYKSFGADGFVSPVLDADQRVRSGELFKEVYSRITSKVSVEELAIRGVRIGDLVYDNYLREYSQPTVDKLAPDFIRSLQDSIDLFVFWDDYLTRHDVRAINVSHCVYANAIPLRLGVSRGIPVFQINLTHAYRLDAQHLFAYNDFHYFRERFAALPARVRQAGLEEARRRVDRRFAGEVGVDMSYSTQSAFGAPRDARLLRPSSRKKILIAAHCFFDSPHAYGDNIFPDFYEWLDFLGRMTECTDYDWYIKTHPDFLPGSKEVVDAFLERYPRLKLLPSNASHHQIIADGIDVALTVYGTIGFEYAALGIPVICASQNNPHIAYEFNVHAKNVEHYRELLLNLDDVKRTIDLAQVYEYYFMAFIHNSENLFLSNYAGTVRELGGYSQQFTPAVYDAWLAEWTPEKHASLIARLRAFVKSGVFRMTTSDLDDRAVGTVVASPVAFVSELVPVGTVEGVGL